MRFPSRRYSRKTLLSRVWHSRVARWPRFQLSAAPRVPAPFSGLPVVPLVFDAHFDAQLLQPSDERFLQLVFARPVQLLAAPPVLAPASSFLRLAFVQLRPVEVRQRQLAGARDPRPACEPRLPDVRH